MSCEYSFEELECDELEDLLLLAPIDGYRYRVFDITAEDLLFDLCEVW